jgi:hypothetical protein
MAAGSKETSGYISSISSVINGCYFVAGFTFTVITLLLTQLKDPTAMFSQVVLFLLNILLGLSIFLGTWYTVHLSTSFTYAPHPTRGYNAVTGLTSIVAALTTLITTLLFFLFGMVYLGLASSIAWVALNVSAYLFVVKPARQVIDETEKRERKSQKAEA